MCILCKWGPHQEYYIPLHQIIRTSQYEKMDLIAFNIAA
jgi:hypothetical protein